MGMRMRLKASFDVSSFSATNQVILNALKKYGMIMADNGSSMYISGAPDDRWDNDDLHNLGNVTASDFEVVQMSPIYTASNVPTGALPAIASFTASAQLVAPGTPVTLSWNVSGASYFVVSPDVGAVRGTSVVVTPAQSTTYTLVCHQRLRPHDGVGQYHGKLTPPDSPLLQIAFIPCHSSSDSRRMRAPVRRTAIGD